jgi:hypothetical protein
MFKLIKKAYNEQENDLVAKNYIDDWKKDKEKQILLERRQLDKLYSK